MEKQKLPPNQRTIEDFPVLDLGIYPKIDMKSWRFTVDGEVDIPLEVAMDGDVLFAFGFEGKPFEYEHGGSLRLIVPKKYAYNSAKWVTRVTFLAQEKLGYWELRGYSNSADP